MRLKFQLFLMKGNTMKNINPTHTQAWKALEAHKAELSNTTIQDLFKQEKNRFDDYSLTFNDQILVDFSKKQHQSNNPFTSSPTCSRMRT